MLDMDHMFVFLLFYYLGFVELVCLFFITWERKSKSCFYVQFIYSEDQVTPGVTLSNITPPNNFLLN